MQPALFLLNSLTVGGSEKKSVAIANALHRRGREVHLVYLNPPETLLPMVDPGVRTLWLRRRSKLDLGAAGRLADYCRHHRVSQMFCINEYPMLYGSLVRRRLGRGFTSTVFINTTDLPTRRAAAKMLVYAPVLRRAQEIVFGCRQQRDAWVSRYRLDGERCGHLYNGIDAQRFSRERLPPADRELRRTLGWSEQDVVIGMVGQLLPKKGYPDFLAALTRLRDQGVRCKGLIVGAGPEAPRLRSLANTARLDDDVAFAGELPDVRPALYAMDVFALTSVAVETFSNAALEAMAMELPVVLSRIGGAAEMVEPGRNGELYPIGDVEALSARLRQLIEAPELRERMGREARRRVLEQFAFERMVDQYERLLQPRDDAGHASGVAA